MEWTQAEKADIRRAEQALERLRRSLKDRGKWWWMWRIQDVQHQLQITKREVAGEATKSNGRSGFVDKPVDKIDFQQANLAALIVRKAR